MTESERFAQLESLFHELQSLGQSERSNRLDVVRASDAALADELLRLLRAPSLHERGIDALQGTAQELRGLGDSPRSSALNQLDDSPASLGRYRLLQVLGEGGMGCVHLAEQVQPVHRMVALKIIRRGFDSAEMRARFRAERQALAVLTHPNIAAVLDAGSSDDGRPWFAMEYVPGVSITEWAEAHNLDARQRILLMLRVCDAVAHAHLKGLIHRDLKPSNILVLGDGGLGQPKVIDFGIAKLMDDTHRDRPFATAFGELVGTPEYMSPEQAAMGAVDVDTRADVYALGLVLHELLVGSLPLSGDVLRQLPFHEMCRRIREDQTQRPSAHESLSGGNTAKQRALRGDLDAVLMKALAKDREQRYGSATALAEDLQRYLDNLPVFAQPPSRRYRAGKFVRRHRVPAAAAVLVLLALMTGIGLNIHQQTQTRRALVQAERNLQDAQLRNDIANAYADSLRLTFGGDADVERLTAMLLEHARKRHAARSEATDAAALASFAIGRHFLSRNDYTSARAVFEPWLAEDYGAQDLRSYGWQLLGFAYRSTGESELALSAFRRAEQLSNPDKRGSSGWASRLAQIAILSGRHEDHRAAISAIQGLLDNTEDAEQQKGLLNSLYQLHVAADELDPAYDAMHRAVAIIDSNPNLELAGRDTNRLNLARLELFNRRDIQAARLLLQQVRDQDLQGKGVSRESAMVLELEGTALRMEGSLQPAFDTLEQALPIYDRFLGEHSLERRRTEMLMIMLLVDMKRMDDARLFLAEAVSSEDDADDLRLVVAETYLAQHDKGASAAADVLRKRRVETAVARRQDYLRHIIDAWISSGIAASPSTPNPGAL